MRIQLLSDLHLERYPDYEPAPATDADVLVLAGDIGSYQVNSRLQGDDFGLARFSPRRAGSPWKQVVFVPGNHEFDGLCYRQTRTRLQALCSDLGITCLDGAASIIDGVRFIGSTLWSDFDALGGAQRTLAGRLKQREKAFRAADFYLSKNTTQVDGRPALAETVRELALDAQQVLRRLLETPFAGPTVVVTHFAPSLRSADPRYGVTPSTAGFCNALDDWLALADVWMHGHLHCPNDYVADGVDAGGRPHRCRVVANPRGYASKGEQEAFVEGYTVDVALTSPRAALHDFPVR